MNATVPLWFELTHYDPAIQNVNHYTTETSPLEVLVV